MKFPKSVHPDGFYDHIDHQAPSTGSPAARPTGAVRKPLKPGLGRPSVKIRATDPLNADAAAPLSSGPIPVPPARRSGSPLPWVLGVGAGAVVIGMALSMSRQLGGNDAPSQAPTMMGEVTPPAPAASTPEDTLLAEAPPAAGTTTPESQPEAQAAATASPEPAPQVAAAAPVAEPRAPAEPARVARAEPAPVTRTLPAEPQTWVVSQAQPPVAELRETAPVTPAPTVAQPAAPVTAQPVAPAALPPVTETPPLVQQATPTVAAQPQPPVLAQQTLPATPPAATAEDGGITLKVREALAADAALAAVPIAVSTDHGVVKLEGQAPDALVRERATVVAAATTGVRGVDNRLTLAPVTVGALTHGAQ